MSGSPILEPGSEHQRELDRIRQQLSAVPAPIAMLEGIFAFSPLGLQIYKASGECLLVNRAFREIFGSEPPPGYNVLRDEIAARAGVLSTVQQAFAGKTVHMPTIWYDPRELTQVDVKEGRRAGIEATFFPLFDEGGAVAHVAVVFKDVTAELQCQEQARREQEILREENRLIETLQRIGATLTAELDIDKLVQRIIDEASALVRAAYGAFFYNVQIDGGEAYTLCALSGAGREALSHLPSPRKTKLFTPAFEGDRVIRLDDVRDSTELRAHSPFFGLPPDQLPVRSYLAAPVISYAGRVLGGLFFGHPERGVFTERDERMIAGVAAQAVVALDNARLYKEAQAATRSLRESEQYHRLVTEAIPPIVWTARPDGAIEYFNQRWITFTGVSLAEAEGWGWLSALHPDDVPRTVERWKEALASGQTYQDEYRLKRAGDGGYCWFLTKALPLRDDSGRMVKWFGTCTDINDQKRIEEEREDLLMRERAARAEAESAEQRFKFLSEASAVLASSLEYEKTFNALVNLAVPRIADCGIVSMLSSGGSTTVIALACATPELREAMMEIGRRYPPSADMAHGYPRVLRTGEPELMSYVDEATPRAVADDAEHLRMIQSLGIEAEICVPIHVQGRPTAALTLLSSGSGRRFSQADLAMASDLARRAGLALENAMLHAAEQTARWEAERAASRVFRLQAVTSALAESLTRAQVADVAVEQSVAALGGQQGILYVPSGDGKLTVLKQMGLSPEASERLQDMPLEAPSPPCRASRTSQPVWIESEEALRAEYPEAAALLEPLMSARAMACVPIHLDGPTAGVMVVCFAEARRFNEDDRFLLVTLARQCTQALDRARLYEAEREARREAQAANRAKDEFLSIVSHELRTPLNAILGWAQILERRADDQDALKKGLSVIERNAKAQVRIIEDILDVSRIITGKLRLDMRPLDVEAVVRAAVEVVRPAAEAKHIAITLAIDEPALVSGDADRLQQVVWNLLSNAIKFTPRDGRVEVRVQVSAGAVQVSVSDTGKGISPEFLPYVFDRFRQADSSTSRGHGGLGLGLAIVRYLVEMHGGMVDAESAGEGRGATFHVTLPLRDDRERPSSPGARRPPEDARARVEPVRIEGLRVLVVDDELDARELLTTILEAHGATVHAVASAVDARAALERLTPDLLLSDIGMPGEDGLAFLRGLRAQGSALPAIALTAYASAEDMKKALLAGFQSHLAKPVEAGALTAAIASLAAAQSSRSSKLGSS